MFHAKRNVPTYRRIRVSRFDNGFAQWKKDPAGMVVKCAEADAFRSTFPTLLGGLVTREEMGLQIEAPAAQTESRTISEALTKRPPARQIVNEPQEPQGGGGEVNPDGLALMDFLIASGVQTEAFEAWLVKNRHIEGYEENARTLKECVDELTPTQAENLFGIAEEIVKACKPEPKPEQKPKKAAAPKPAPAAQEEAPNVVNLPPPGEDEPEPIIKCRAAMAKADVTEAQLIAWGKHPRTNKLHASVNTLADAYESNIAFITWSTLKMEIIKKEIVALKL